MPSRQIGLYLKDTEQTRLFEPILVLESVRVLSENGWHWPMWACGWMEIDLKRYYQVQLCPMSKWFRLDQRISISNLEAIGGPTKVTWPIHIWTSHMTCPWWHLQEWLGHVICPSMVRSHDLSMDGQVTWHLHEWLDHVISPSMDRSHDLSAMGNSY